MLPTEYAGQKCVTTPVLLTSSEEHGRITVRQPLEYWRDCNTEGVCVMMVVGMWQWIVGYLPYVAFGTDKFGCRMTGTLPETASKTEFGIEVLMDRGGGG